MKDQGKDFTPLHPEQGKVETSRRDFFKVMGVGAAAATGIPALVPASAFAAAPPATPGLPLGRQTHFAMDPNWVHFNIGTTGSTPAHVLKNFNDYNRMVARNPRENLGGANPTRESMARGFGCTTDEIAMSYNTTDGMNKILRGVVLNAGDEILSTNHEHPGGNNPMNYIANRKGVIITRLPMPVGSNAAHTAQSYVDLFAANIKPNTKAFCFSAPTYLTGTMLPYKRLAALAQQHGLFTIVDGAHATGMLNLKFDETGIDYWGCSGHKWQCGPGGTGVLYVRNKVTAANPLPVFDFWPSFGATTMRSASTPLNVGNALQSIGNPNYPMLRAFKDTCDFWDQVGRANIEAHDLALSEYLKQRLIALFGEGHLYCPTQAREPELVSGLTSFHPFSTNANQNMTVNDGTKTTTFINRLFSEYGFNVRTTTVPVVGSAMSHHPLRISTHLWHSQQDVENLVTAMRALATAMGPGLV